MRSLQSVEVVSYVKRYPVPVEKCRYGLYIVKGRSFDKETVEYSRWPRVSIAEHKFQEMQE
jgi:hypothetical protein